MGQIILNGKPWELGSAATVSELLEAVRLDARGVIIEHNGCLVTPDKFTVSIVAPGDTVEIVRLIGGG